MIQFQAILDGVSKKKDSTLSLRIGTQELPAEDTAKIFELGNREVWVCMADVPVKEDDLEIPEVLSEFKRDKSPSQRLRDVLWVFWDKSKKDYVDWDTYYRNTIEKIVENIKDKLE